MDGLGRGDVPAVDCSLRAMQDKVRRHRLTNYPKGLTFHANGVIPTSRASHDPPSAHGPRFGAAAGA